MGLRGRREASEDEAISVVDVKQNAATFPCDSRVLGTGSGHGNCCVADCANERGDDQWRERVWSGLGFNRETTVFFPRIWYLLRSLVAVKNNLFLSC